MAAAERGWAVALLCCMSLVGTEARCASDPSAPRSISFDIPAQPLQAALEQFMTVTTHSGLYDSALMRGRYSTAVNGVMEPEVALRRMVAESGLNVRYAEDGTFTITPNPAIAPGSAPPPLQALASKVEQARTQYFGELQADIKEVFCTYPATRSGSYRVALSLWIKPSGEVDQVRLLDTSGSPERDALITEGLRSMRSLAPMPAAIRPPITLVIVPKSLGCVDAAP